MNSKMPISLLRNNKTVSYLNGMFAILEEEKGGLEYQPLQRKVNTWLQTESNRLDLSEKESALLEQCSYEAYGIANAQQSVTSQERAFMDQHEFFFKS